MEGSVKTTASGGASSGSDRSLKSHTRAVLTPFR
jgi:hypothetical protein